MTMKITGLCLMVIAVGILAYCAVHVVLLDDAPGTPPPPAERAPVLLVPFTIAVVTGLAGVMLYVYGGDGYGTLPKPPEQPIESREVTNSFLTHHV
jgi:hypothetical protein